MSANLLELAGVHTHIGAYHILHGVDLVVPEGQVTMLLGRNGAGKSTTLKTLMGMVKPRSGQVRFDGVDHGINARHRRQSRRKAYRERGIEHRDIGIQQTRHHALLLAARRRHDRDWCDLGTGTRRCRHLYQWPTRTDGHANPIRRRERLTRAGQQRHELRDIERAATTEANNTVGLRL